MSNSLESFINNLPATGSPLDTPNIFSKTGRAVIKSDNRAVVQARSDYNAAKLLMHRNQLNQVIELAENRHRAELAADAMQNAKVVHHTVSHLAQGDPHLEMMLRDMQNAYNNGEAIRIMRRGMGA